MKEHEISCDIDDYESIKFVIGQIIKDNDDKTLFTMYLENKYMNRDYHNLLHIEQVLVFSNYMIQDLIKTGFGVESYLFDTVNKSIEFKTFLIAILFHDVIQTPSLNISIALSINEAKRVCNWFDIECDFELLERLIISTNHPCTYKNEKANENYKYKMLCDIIHDADLTILSTLSFTLYMKYSKKIYKEYMKFDLVQDGHFRIEFYKKRKEFLIKLLKENIFTLCINKLEHNTQGKDIIARKNIKREIDMIENEIYVY